MPIKTLFFVYLFWIKFCLSERLRDCTLVHSLSLICYLLAAVEILIFRLWCALDFLLRITLCLCSGQEWHFWELFCHFYVAECDNSKNDVKLLALT